MKDVNKITVLRLQGDMIFVNASHRRSILSPWVFLCFGDQMTLTQVWDDIITGKFNSSPVPYDHTADLEHWHIALTRLRQQQ